MDLIEKTRIWAEKTEEIVFATVFGSFADNRASEKSDLDVAILGHHTFSADLRVKMSQELGSIVNREIDLVDLSDSHGPIVKQALVGSKIIKNSDPDFFASRLKQFYLNEADYGPLRDRAYKERRDRVFQTKS